PCSMSVSTTICAPVLMVGGLEGTSDFIVKPFLINFLVIPVDYDNTGLLGKTRYSHHRNTRQSPIPNALP
ncbi:MAG TPA: hypothetical protein VIJ25_07240, partial [Methylococcales bacterium]